MDTLLSVADVSRTVAAESPLRKQRNGPRGTAIENPNEWIRYMVCNDYFICFVY